MKSAIYTGEVFHSRYLPKSHHFRYKVYMMYLMLGEEDIFIGGSSLVSRKRWAPLQIKREDFHGNPEHTIKSEVEKTVQQELGLVLRGPIAVLSNWRCFGFNFNPLTVYYCFSEDGAQLEAIVAEVTNTPWHERHAYVLRVPPEKSDDFTTKIEKTFTVSPFNPIDMQYEWASTRPEDVLKVGLINYSGTSRVFQATLNLRKVELNEQNIRKNIRGTVLRFPFMTLKVITAIYWQALRLYLKGIPFLGKDKKISPSY